MSSHSIIGTPDNVVQSTGVTESEEEEYEEALVLVKFSDITDVNFFMESKEIEINNIEGVTPQCYIEGFNFAGTHSVNLGTLLFFEKKNLPGDQSDIEFAGSTTTTLDFSLRHIPIVEAQPS